MREIKFRAWGIDGKIRTPQMWGWNQIKNVLDMWIDEEGSVLMQFTGLHDKKGKEIYEGDIVSIPDYWIVYYHYNGFCLARKRKQGVDFPADENGYVCYATSWENIEVIGNIYENADLLGGTQKAPENAPFSDSKNDSSI